MVTTTIEDVGDGWYRFTTIATFANSTNTRLYIYPDVANSSNAGFIYIWHPQVSQHTTLPVGNPYIKTEGSAVYAARLDHDPTWFMSAAQEQNLFNNSEIINDAYWGKNALTVTANTTETTDPLGGNTAEKVVETSANAEHSVEANERFFVTEGKQYTMSAYVKLISGSDRRIRLRFTGLNNAFVVSVATFDLTTQTISSNTCDDATIEDVGNGWFRCAVTETATATIDTLVRFDFQKTDGDTLYTGDTSVGFYLWGLQFEVGSTASTYHRTEGAPYYGEGATPKGLLIEEQRANLVDDSEDFSAASWSLSPSANLQVNTNQVLAPDGTTTADELEVTGTPSAGVYRIRDVVSMTSGQTYISSVFGKKSGQRYLVLLWEGAALSGQVKGGVDLETGNIITGSDASTTVEDYGNGWYRVSISATATSSAGASAASCLNDADDISVTHTPTAGDSIYLWGAQVEEGSFPTSYIQTTGTTLTRNADVAVMGPTTGGTELVTNGTFDTDTTGWSENKSVSSVSSGQLVIDHQESGSAFFYQNISVVSGRRYRLTHNVVSATGSVFHRIGDGSSILDGSVFANVAVSTGDNEIDFTAPSTNLINFTLAFTSGSGGTFDNVSVRELYPFEQYNQSEGTIVAEMTQNTLAGSSTYYPQSIFFREGTTFDGIYLNNVIGGAADTLRYIYIQSDGASQVNGLGQTVAAGTPFVQALSYTTNHVDHFVSGSVPSGGQTDGSCTLPHPDSVHIGLSGKGTYYIKRLTYFNRKVSDDTLQFLSDV